MNNECWAIIPARSGSKGIPGKNIKLLNGKPLISYSIENLIKSKIFNKIIVTSDSTEILKVSKKMGANIFLRSDPKESNDIVMPDVPTISFLKSIPEKIRPKWSFMIQCTSPFIKEGTYEKAFKLLKKNIDLTVFAATEANIFLWEEKKNDINKIKWEPVNHPFNVRVGRQFKEKMEVCETGAFYGFETSKFIEANHRFFNKAAPILLKSNEGLDINTMDDWMFAEHLSEKNIINNNELL